MDKKSAHIISLIKSRSTTGLRQASLAIGPRIFALAMEITGSKEEAQEVTSDVLIKIFNGIGSFDPDKAAFSTWMMRIAHNEAIARLRQRRSLPQTCELKGTLMEISHADNEGTRLELVKEAIERCTMQERELINLYYYDNNSLKEISEITGVAAGTLAVRLRRIRLKIKPIYRAQTWMTNHSTK